MNQSEILYVPWFREAQNKRMPGIILEKYFASKNIPFSRMKLPGDRENNDESSLFSMTWVQDSIVELLNWLQNNTSVISYSLTAFSVLEAVQSVSKQIRDKVKRVIFLHPAKNPLSAVAMMDWAIGDHDLILDTTHYLKWDKYTIFSTLIGDWRGNPEIFQDDLHRYNGLILGNSWYFDARTWELRDEIPDIRVLESDTDSIVSTDSTFDTEQKRAKEKANLSHIPTLSPEILERVFS